MSKKISFHYYIAGVGEKHLTFYHEPGVTDCGPVVRVVLLDADGTEVAETMLGRKDVARLGAWLRGVSLREVMR